MSAPAVPKPCAAPTMHAFDIDIYDCPCGHMYGDHEYIWCRGVDDRKMEIVRCTKCPRQS